MIDPLFELIASIRECYGKFNSAKKNQQEKVRKYISSLLIPKKSVGLQFIDLRSGDIHARLNFSDRLPTVCDAP